MTFASVPVRATFWFNGNWCVKRSQRTARVASYGWFYFNLTDVVTLGVPA